MLMTRRCLQWVHMGMSFFAIVAVALSGINPPGSSIGLSRLAPQNPKTITILKEYEGGVNKPDDIEAVALSPDGRLIGVGKAHPNFQSKFDFLTMSSRLDGSEFWVKIFGPISSGGDKEYRAGALSEQFWRSDIAEDVAFDPKGNVYVIGSSTLDTSSEAIRKQKDFGARIVSCTTFGELRFQTTIEDIRARHKAIKVSDSGMVYAMVVAGYSRQKDYGNPTVLLQLDSRTGKVKARKEMGTDLEVRDMNVGADGHVRILAGQQRFDPVHYAFAHTYPKLNSPSRWYEYVISPQMKVIEKRLFDESHSAIRGKGALCSDGRVAVLSIKGGQVLLECWRKGTRIWSRAMSLDDTDIYSMSLWISNSAITANTDTIFVFGGPSTELRDRLLQDRVQAFRVADGSPAGEYVLPPWRPALVGTDPPAYGVHALRASEDTLAAGGAVYRRQQDAWIGFWKLNVKDQ